MIVVALALVTAPPALGSMEQVWSRCLNDRVTARLRLEDERELWSKPSELTSWAFVECGVDFDAFARDAKLDTIKNALRRERRSLEKTIRLDQSGRNLRDI